MVELFPPMDAHAWQYSWHSRAERLLAIGRLVLATVSLVAIWLDPAEPSRHETIAYSILGGYVIYAGLIALLVRHSPTSLLHLRLAVHSFDLVVFALLMYFTEGPTSPFFAYITFALLCATLRWSWPGTLWTAGVALATFVGIGIYSAEVLREPSFELSRFIIRSVYLAVIAGLLAYFSASVQRWRSELSSLAAWPRRAPAEAGPLVRQVLEHAASILATPRVLMVWEDPEEPWCHEALWWSNGDFSWRQASIDALEAMVAAPLAGSNFLYLPTGPPPTMVLYSSPDGLGRWHGVPVTPECQARFRMHEVLSFSLQGEIFRGRLFLLDNSRLTADALIVGEIVAHHVVAALDQWYMVQQLRHAAANEERFRLARDLHDGLLQSLSTAVFQLDALSNSVEQVPQTIKEQVQSLQHLLRAEQRGLRRFIDGLKSAPLGPLEEAVPLAIRLHEVQERLERQWGLHVDMTIELRAEQIPESLAQELYFIIHEALVNVARHARASIVHVDLSQRGDQVRVMVADDGRGFPFRGRFDLSALRQMQAGPVMLRQRVASMGGSLTINSSEAGAHLEITVPLAQEGRQDAD